MLCSLLGTESDKWGLEETIPIDVNVCCKPIEIKNIPPFKFCLFIHIMKQFQI